MGVGGDGGGLGILRTAILKVSCSLIRHSKDSVWVELDIQRNSHNIRLIIHRIFQRFARFRILAICTVVLTPSLPRVADISTPVTAC